MNHQKQHDPVSHQSRSREILAFVWISTAILATFATTILLNGAFPLFTLLFLAVPLTVLLRTRNASRIGFRFVRRDEIIRYTVLNLAGSLITMVIFEPWSHTYQMLLSEAIASSHPDTTFGWLAQFPGITGWTGFLLYAGLVTLFAEELFFRGWLLNWMQARISAGLAILLQAALFTLPQLLAAFLLPPLQGLLYAIIYSWLAIGLIGGWAASRTGSIWPSLISATSTNLVMCILVI